MATSRKATSTKAAKTSKKVAKKHNLIIVESPAKAKTIKNFLGSDYEVIASKGHIRDLPEKAFGITVKDKHFIPKYDISAKNKDVVEHIRTLHKNAKTTYIATDEDREGEAIGFHIIEALSGNIKDFPRIVFHEITKSAITHSLENPRRIDMDRVNAQQARRLLDRIVGYKLSSLISQKISRGLSAGRVQSSALKILVDREREIRVFVPEDYFLINALMKIDENDENSHLVFDLVRFGDKKIEKLSLKDRAEVDEILSYLSSQSFHIDSITKKQRVVKSPPPFMTSTLQQSSSSALGFSPTKTMQIAQNLYEGVMTNNGLAGVITYMRTDSLNIAKEALDSVREFILKDFGEEYLPDKPKAYATKQKSAQEAHEAIRPTNLAFNPSIAKSFLKPDELKLYTLIFNRFVASQMKDAIYENENVSVLCKNGRAEFKITGKRLIFSGFYEILGNDDKDRLLPKLSEGSAVVFSEISDVAKSTEPPPHYSEAGLVKELESLGIGRPSTYAPTIRLLVDRNYVALEGKKLVVQDIAFSVIEMLEGNFNEIVDSGFSASLEDKLDDIAASKLDWENVLWDFYEPFMQKIADGKKQIQSQKTTTPTGEFCPECGGELVIRNGRYGEFISCSNYPTCKYIKRDDSDETNEICEKCGAAMQVKMSKRGKFLACSAYPKCKNAKPLNKPKTLGIKCPKCGGEIMERSSRRGIFYGCSNYPKCKFTSNLVPTDRICDSCGSVMCRHKSKENTLVCAECKAAVEL